VIKEKKLGYTTGDDFNLRREKEVRIKIV